MRSLTKVCRFLRGTHQPPRSKPSFVISVHQSLDDSRLQAEGADLSCFLGIPNHQIKESTAKKRKQKPAWHQHRKFGRSFMGPTHVLITVARPTDARSSQMWLHLKWKYTGFYWLSEPLVVIRGTASFLTSAMAPTFREIVLGP